MPLLDTRERVHETTIQRQSAAAVTNVVSTAADARIASQTHLGPQQSAGQVPSLSPSPDAVATVITTLLEGRPDAADILISVADRLELILDQQQPGLAHDSPASQPQKVTDRASLAAAMAVWRLHAVRVRRLRKLIVDFRLRHASPDKPKVTRVSTWSERDAVLRDDAVSLSSLGSSASHPPSLLPTTLPFVVPEDLPAELKSHKSHSVLCKLLESTADRTLLRWRRRALYTEDNWKEWAAWTPTDRTHRDAHNAGNRFSDATLILIAPDLRNPDPAKTATAWDAYRRHLIVEIRQALRFGFPWPDILARLSNTYSHATNGYPRLANYITTALDDPVMLEYPLLHADLLIYRLDCSYASGSRQYESDSMTALWDTTVSRLPGEDLVSLALRVINAFLMKEADSKLTSDNVWDQPSLTDQINRRYAECLLNDVANPDRGDTMSTEFLRVWGEAKALHHRGRLDSTAQLGCEFLAEARLIPHESAYCYYAAPPSNVLTTSRELPQLPAPGSASRTGADSRARRHALRYHLGRSRDHNLEPPPSAYLQDSLPEDGE